jgi:glycerol-3-phosphate acyltransferase PlsY
MVERILSGTAILLAAYLLGSIPFAYIVSRLAAGVDIRTVGDGNVGARNTFLSVGAPAGITVGVLDICKGMGAVTMVRILSGSEEMGMVAGMAAVFGHDFSPFLNFHGGQGVAAMVGAFLCLFPYPTAAALGLTCATILLSRNWDAGWAVGFVVLIALVALWGYGWNRVLYTILLIPTIGLRKLLQIIRREGPGKAERPS